MIYRCVCVDIKGTYTYNWLEYDTFNLSDAFRIRVGDIFVYLCRVYDRGVVNYSIGIL